jgi:hypothetical protein
VKNPDDEKNINVQPFYPRGNMGGFAGQVNKPTFYSSFCILFRTENINKPILYYQYNPEFKESAYSINYVYASKNLKNIPVPAQPDQDNKVSYYSKYQDNMINETPGLFVFLIDQSGSMSGKSIDLVKQALLLFIQSLPEGSYFQLIGFGSNFKKYNPKPVEYNQGNVTNIINIINDLKANMGGTNISQPLDAIYKDSSYSSINLSKNIFLLTDGQVHDREQCINLISTNSNKFRIHSLGIGDDFDKVLIERSGKLGKGTSSFVENVENINTVVIDTLNKCLRPYLIDIHFNFKNYENNSKNCLVKCNPINNFTYQDEIMNYSLILDNNNKIDVDNLSESINIEIVGKDPKNPIKENISFNKNQNIIKLPNGDEMTKMIVGKALKNNKEFLDNKNKEIEFALKYQILSKNTALFAEILNDGNDGQTKLVKVNLNDYKTEISRDFRGFGRIMPKADLCCNSMPIGSIGMKKRSMRSKNMACVKSSAPMKRNLALNSINMAMGSNDYCNARAPAPMFVGNSKNINLSRGMAPQSNMEKTNKIQNNNNNNSKGNNEIKDDNLRLIMSQDIIEGSWNVNEDTKKLINIITHEKFNLIDNKVKGLKKGDQETKIIYTILVIYYLMTKHSEKLNDYKLVINKAKKFLMSKGINYDDFIVGI